jgi:thiol-disulfide isomerase/thioredoxin
VIARDELMMRYFNRHMAAILALGYLFVAPAVTSAQPPATQDVAATNGAPTTAQPPAQPPWPTLKIPDTKSAEELGKFLVDVKKLQPTTSQRYIEMQTIIRDTSKRILEMTADRTSEFGRTAEFDFVSSSVMLMGNDGPDAQKKTFERFRDYIKAKQMPDENDLKMVLMAGQNLEQTSDPKTVGVAYREFAKILEAKKIESLQVWIDMLKGNAIRVELPGKELPVSGKTVTGEDFDIKSCKGKITLVYFWSPLPEICKPCREEYAYTKKLYLENRDKGFEIVAISVDPDKEKLNAALKELEVPWINLWDEENESQPAAVQKYGISAIPTMILLDREGKVISLEARGLLLGKLLEKHLAEPKK